MDLNTVTEVARPASREEIAPWRAGDAWLAGGTWLFSEPQPAVRRLVDARTSDAFGPFGAKSMSESPINPVAPALANAPAGATGIRSTSLPLAPDRLYRAIAEAHAPGAVA